MPFLPLRAAGFATAAVRVPLQLYSLDGRYATALYTATAKTGGSALLAPVQNAMEALKQIIQRDARIMAFLSDPTQKKSDKRSVVQSIAQRLGTGPSQPLVLNLLLTLAEHGRLAILDRILLSFDAIMRAHRKEIPVSIVSAKELNSADRQQLTDRITKQFIPDGHVPVFQTITDPKILGGLVINIADRTIDMSVSSKVSRINNELSRGF